MKTLPHYVPYAEGKEYDPVQAPVHEPLDVIRNLRQPLVHGKHGQKVLNSGSGGNFDNLIDNNMLSKK